MSFSKSTSPGYLTNHLARLFAQELGRRIKPLGIAPGQFAALLELFEKDRQTQKKLVAKLDIEQATLANTLTRMERDGFIRRDVHPTDARARVITLTDKAHAIRADVYAAAQATNADALSGLTADDRDRFIHMMQTVISTLRGQHD